MANSEVSRLKFNDTTYEIADELARESVGTALAEVASVEAKADAYNTALSGRITNLENSSGAVLVAKTRTAMTDTNKIYVYTGTTTTASGVTYTKGHWYYHNGSKWTDGGQYNQNLDAIDATLTQSNKGADAKVTGDRLTAAETDISTLRGTIANEYASQVYSVGDYCYHDGLLYRCNTEIAAAEAWTSSHWTAVDVMPELNNLKNDYKDAFTTYQITDYMQDHSVMQSGVNNSVTYTWGGRTCTVAGTATSASFSNYLIMDIDGVKSFTLLHETTDSNIMSRVWFVDSNNGMTLIDTRGSRLVTVPDNCVQIVIRLQIASGQTVNGVVTVGVLSNFPLNYFPSPKPIDSYISNNILDLNNVYEEGRYLVSSSLSLQHSPLASMNGVIIVQKASLVKNWTRQILLSPASGDTYTRWNTVDNWTEWLKESPSVPVWQLGLPDGTDLNDMIGSQYNGYYGLSDAREYSNCPITVGFLFSCTLGNACLQICVSWTGFVMYKRRAMNGVWSDWETISGGSGGGGNEYTFNEYNNTYNVTATPSIQIDTNNYLAPSGTNVDRTSDIASMLETTGVCNLGPGDFYVSNLEMPENTTLRGSGAKTRIILSGTGDGFAIKMGTKCLVKDLQIIGSLSAVSLSSTLGDRHGILWHGNYTEDNTSANQPTYGLVSDCWISQFTGGGITCYDTGYGTYNHLQVTNVDINGCRAGINLSYWTEFHKFTNVTAMNCWYGVINNGGNNIFTNCEFCNCETAMLFDNSSNQSPNNTHGSVIGCMFGHCGRSETDGSGVNLGYGVKMYNCHNAEIFSGCHFGYARILTESSDGVVFDGCNFIGGVISGVSSPITINITGGNTHLFSGCVFSMAPSISVSNNTKTHFANCYRRDTGNVVES